MWKDWKDTEGYILYYFNILTGLAFNPEHLKTSKAEI